MEEFYVVSCFYAELGNNCIYEGAFMVLFLNFRYLQNRSSALFS